jgi:hypothetical protein
VVVKIPHDYSVTAKFLRELADMVEKSQAYEAKVHK